MLVWTHWGMAIPFLGYLGALIGNYGALFVGQQLRSDAPWLMAVGSVAGAMAASLLIMMFREWRATRGGEPQKRALIAASTGERFDVQNPGDTLFWIHSRHWIWLALVFGAGAAAVTLFEQTPLHEI